MLPCVLNKLQIVIEEAHKGIYSQQGSSGRSETPTFELKLIKLLLKRGGKEEKTRTTAIRNSCYHAIVEYLFFLGQKELG